MTSSGTVQRHRRPFRAAAATLATALVLAACGGEDTATPAPEAPGEAGPISIVATTAILGDVVANLLGDDGTVQVLMDRVSTRTATRPPLRTGQRCAPLTS